MSRLLDLLHQIDFLNLYLSDANAMHVLRSCSNWYKYNCAKYRIKNTRFQFNLILNAKQKFMSSSYVKIGRCKFAEFGQNEKNFANVLEFGGLMQLRMLSIAFDDEFTIEKLCIENIGKYCVHLQYLEIFAYSANKTLLNNLKSSIQQLPQLKSLFLNFANDISKRVEIELRELCSTIGSHATLVNLNIELSETICEPLFTCLTAKLWKSLRFHFRQTLQRVTFEKEFSKYCRNACGVETLEFVTIPNEEYHIFEYLPLIPQLKHVLFPNFLARFNLKGLDYFLVNSKLKSLKLPSFDNEDQFNEIVTQKLLHQTELTALDICQNYLYSTSWNTLKNLLSLNVLKTLKVRLNTVEIFQNNESLESLYCFGLLTTHICQTDFLNSHPNLSQLYFDDPLIDDRIFKNSIVSSISRNKKLKILSISSNGLSVSAFLEGIQLLLESGSNIQEFILLNFAKVSFNVSEIKENVAFFTKWPGALKIKLASSFVLHKIFNSFPKVQGIVSHAVG